MNTYVKFAPNVFVAKTQDTFSKDDVIIMTTKYGKEIECIIHNLLLQKDGYGYYSITRADGYNSQQRAIAKANRYSNWAVSAERKSDEFYDKSQKDKDFLSLGEPIKVGHHSEKRHRKVIDQAWNNMGKSVEFQEKANSHESKSEYWNSRANEINLSMPDSLEYFEFKLAEAKENHEGLKSGRIPKSHAYSLTYAKKDVNELQKKFDLAKRLWA